MLGFRRLDVAENGDIVIATFVDSKIIDDAQIQEIGAELFRLVETENCKKVILDFGRVDFFSSACWGKVITLKKKLQRHGGWKPRLANVRPEIYETIAITRIEGKVLVTRDTIDEAAMSFEETPDQ